MEYGDFSIQWLFMIWNMVKGIFIASKIRLAVCGICTILSPAGRCWSLFRQEVCGHWVFPTFRIQNLQLSLRIQPITYWITGMRLKSLFFHGLFGGGGGCVFCFWLVGFDFVFLLLLFGLFCGFFVGLVFVWFCFLFFVFFSFFFKWEVHLQIKKSLRFCPRSLVIGMTCPSICPWKPGSAFPFLGQWCLGRKLSPTCPWMEMLTEGREKTSDLRDRPVDEDASTVMESIPNPGMFEQMLERSFSFHL